MRIMKKWGITIGLVTILCTAGLLAGCGSSSTPNQGPDYSNTANWLALPITEG